MVNSSKYINLLLLAFFVVLLALVLILSKVYKNYEANQIHLETSQIHRLDSI